MADFKKLYSEKLRSAEDAVKVVKSGDWIDYGFCTGTVRVLDQALAARYEELSDVKVRGAILLEPPAIMSVPNVKEHFTWNSWHMTAVDRNMEKTGAVYYMSMRYSEMPKSYRTCLDPIAVAMMQVAPMDEEGYFNFGPNASHLKAVCDRSDVVIVEVNQKMPRCLGSYDEKVHVSEVDYIVEGSNLPLATMPSKEPNEVDIAVANLIVPEIPNGACLQLGIGGMPNAVGSLIAKTDLKDLGIHSEMYVDSFVDLAETGKINGSKKNIDKNLQTYTFGAGSERLYQYLDGNPNCNIAAVDYVNDVSVISQLDNFISVNNAVDIDLMGQLNSESAGIHHISGCGGQMDFVLGAFLSKGGKSFICMSSTFKNKNGELQSRIKPTLTLGSAITCTRANLHYLVTEQGMVNLKGCSTWERAERIISVAHPLFREGLIKNAEEMHIWRRSNRR